MFPAGQLASRLPLLNVRQITFGSDHGVSHHHRVTVHRSVEHRRIHNSLPRLLNLFRHLFLRRWIMHDWDRFLVNLLVWLYHHLLDRLLGNWVDVAALLLLLGGLRLVAYFGRWLGVVHVVAASSLRVHATTSLLLLHLGRFSVGTNCVYSQGVSGFARFFAHRALVSEATDMRFDVLFDSRSDLGGEMALSALPGGLGQYSVVVRDHQLCHLSV